MILVLTGGTGSLGKAILNQQALLKKIAITRIRVLSRCEQRQIELQRNYKGKIPLDCFLADVSDKERMEFALKNADYVIHAAAQKHIDKFALDIPTGYKNNIVGTSNVAFAFMQQPYAVNGILVSTDKAANPTTAYGISKLASEQTWLWHNTYQKKISMGVTRYGNVYGSKGSVIETWTEQAKNNQPLTITDMECTRFFISLEKAAQFVLKSMNQEISSVAIPDLKGVKMIRVAESIWKKYQKKKMKFKVVGMRQIEKRHEIMIDGALDSEMAPQFTDKELNNFYEEWLKLK